jgi:hypothetical protein
MKPLKFITAAVIAMCLTFASIIPQAVSDAAERGIIKVQNKAVDPTFNGLLEQEECQIMTLVQCGDGYCADVNSISPTGEGVIFALVFDFTRLTVRNPPTARFPDGELVSHIEIIDVSEAGINKPLWVKFRFNIARTIANGVMLLVPAERSGGYIRKFGLVSEPGTNSQFVQAIPGMTSQILGGTCFVVR